MITIRLYQCPLTRWQLNEIRTLFDLRSSTVGLFTRKFTERCDLRPSFNSKLVKISDDFDDDTYGNTALALTKSYT